MLTYQSDFDIIKVSSKGTLTNRGGKMKKTYIITIETKDSDEVDILQIKMKPRTPTKKK